MEDHNKDVPSREETEQKMAGEGVDVKNLPDRQIAERNSAYKLAQEARERWSNDDGSYSPQMQGDDVQNNTTEGSGGQGQSRMQARGGNLTGGNQGGGNTNRSGQGYDTGQGEVSTDFQKENSLDGTVSLNTDPIDGPSKLDQLDARDSGANAKNIKPAR